MSELELKAYVKPLKTNVLGQTIVGQSYYLKSEVDKVIAEKDAQAGAYAESVDAGMRERRLRRALWIARAERASDKARIFYFAETCGVKLNIDGYSNREKSTHKNVYC